MNVQVLLELIETARTEEQVILLDDMFRKEKDLDMNASNLDLSTHVFDAEVRQVQTAIADKLLEVTDFNMDLLLNQCLASFEAAGTEMQSITGFQVLDWLEASHDNSTVPMHLFIDAVAKAGYTLCTPVLKVYKVI